jgi:hypothetical protein
MQPLKQNRFLYRTLIINFSVITVAVLEIIPDVAYMLELVPFPSLEFQVELMSVFLIVFALCYVIEKSLTKIRYRD